MTKTYKKPLKELTLEITQKCPQRCIHCSSNSSISAKEELTIDEIERVIDEFKSLGGETLEISGGEPLSHHSVYETIQYAKKKGLKVYIYSCGISDAHDENSKSVALHIAKEICNLELDRVYVNVEGPNSDIHNTITRTPKSFEKTTYFIRNLIENGLWVGVHFVPMKPNFEEIQDAIDYVSRLGAREIGILRFVPQGRGEKKKEWLALSKDESWRLTEILEQQRKREDIKVRIGCPLGFCFILNKTYRPAECSAGLSRCLVKPNGIVTPCPAFKHLSYYFAGNIRASSLKTIWRKSKAFNILRNFDYKRLRGSCSECSFINICKGRCIAQRIHSYGDPYQGPDPCCPLDFGRDLYKRYS